MSENAQKYDLWRHFKKSATCSNIIIKHISEHFQTLALLFYNSSGHYLSAYKISKSKSKRLKNESGNKKYTKNHYFQFLWVILSLFSPYFLDTLYRMNRILWLSDENLDISRRFRKNLFKIKFTIRVWSDPVKWHDIWQICILLLSTHMKALVANFFTLKQLNVDTMTVKIVFVTSVTQ